MRIVIPGGAGQVGRVLARHFHKEGHDVTVISRRAENTAWRTVVWDGQNLGHWTGEMEAADAVINLAGRSVNCRYNETNRRAILESRVRTTELVGRAIAKSSRGPKVWLNASTATIYRHALDREMDEETGELGGSEPGAPSTWRFSIAVATAWEQAFFGTATPGVRKIALRSAMTMSPDAGGVFDTLLRLVRFGLGGTSGSGEQFVSWVHDRDFIRAVEFLIGRDDLDGVVNVSSPSPVTNRRLMQTLRDAWGARIGLPAAEWMLEIGAVFLRTETELILKSRRVVPGRLLKAGFGFEFPRWAEASRELVQRWREQRTSRDAIVTFSRS